MLIGSILMLVGLCLLQVSVRHALQAVAWMSVFFVLWAGIWFLFARMILAMLMAYPSLVRHPWLEFPVNSAIGFSAWMLAVLIFAGLRRIRPIGALAPAPVNLVFGLFATMLLGVAVFIQGFERTPSSLGLTLVILVLGAASFRAVLARKPVLLQGTPDV